MPVFDMDAIPDEEENAPPWEVIVEPGWYVMRVTACERDHSKAGNLQWKLKLKSEPELGHPVFQIDEFVVLEHENLKVLSKLKSFCRAAGLPTSGASVEIEPHQVIGSQLAVRVKPETYNGKTQMKPAGMWGIYEEPQHIDALRDGTFKRPRRVQAQSSTVVGSKEEKPAGRQPLVDDDSIPF